VSIAGGYFLTARRMYDDESWLMEKPPLFSKLWGWMMARAKWQHGCSGLDRGQFLTSIPKMQEAMAHYVGYRKETPSKDQIRKSYEAFAKRGMIAVMRTTRGLRITIQKYEFYQDPKNYEGHDDCPYELLAKGEYGPPDSKEGKKEERKKKNPPTPQGGSGYTKAFELFWKECPKKIGKSYAFKCWKKIKGVDAPTIIQALRAQIAAEHFRGNDGKQYFPNPSTWLNQGRWEDEIAGNNNGDDALPPELR
jgi:hypothetical protein